MGYGQIKDIKDMKFAPTIDKVGECFRREEDHYYRQENNKVLHVSDGIVNTLDENAINDGRINWGRIYEEISADVFEVKLNEVLQSFYD